MHNAAATALLTVLYLFHAAAMASGAYALGLLTGLLPPRKAAAVDTGLPPALHFCLGVATGAGLLATAVAAEAALRGKFHGFIVSSLPWWSGILAAVGMGLLVRAWIAQRGSAAAAPAGQPLSWLHKALVVACALAAVNVTLNALAPDCQMDSLWYHLSVARAWVEWDCFDAFATVFPSNYSLLHSVLYAIALTMGDEIHCALINGLCGFICFGSAALYTRLWFGRPAAVWCWYLCATAYAAHTWFAPFHTGSDLPVAMFSTTGLLTAVHVLFGLPAGAGASGLGRQSQRLWCLSGFLLGCALAVKITTLGYMIPAWFGLCLWAVWRRPHLRWATPAALALTLLPFLPWAVRSALYGCGNPVYPLARWWLPVREGWEILLRNPSHLSVFPPTWQGLLQSMEFWPQKFQHMAYTRSPGFILHAAVVSALVLRHPLARVFGAIALAQWWAQFWTVGTNELARYFAQCFPVIFPAVAGAVAWFEDRAPVSRPIRTLALAAFAVSVAVPYVQRQIECGAHGKEGWPYRPILTAADKRRYLAARECDLFNYPLYEWINAHTARDSIVLLGDIGHPFYIQRRYLWADPELGLFYYLENHAGIDTPAKARRWLAAHGVDYVVAYDRTEFRSSIWAEATTPTQVNRGTPAMLLRPLPPEPGE